MLKARVESPINILIQSIKKYLDFDEVYVEEYNIRGLLSGILLECGADLDYLKAMNIIRGGNLILVFEMDRTDFPSKDERQKFFENVKYIQKLIDAGLDMSAVLKDDQEDIIEELSKEENIDKILLAIDQASEVASQALGATDEQENKVKSKLAEIKLNIKVDSPSVWKAKFVEVLTNVSADVFANQVVGGLSWEMIFVAVFKEIFKSGASAVGAVMRTRAFLR